MFVKTLLKKRIRHKCFPENLANFLRNLFLTEDLQTTVLGDLRGESHIDFRTQGVIMMLAGGGAFANDVLKMSKVIKLQSLCPAKTRLFRRSVSPKSNSQEISSSF